MIVLEGIESIRGAGLRRPVATLGVFDGVHIGHRVLLNHVVALARERAGDSVVITFADHPRAVISGEAPKLLTSLPHRLRLFSELGISVTIVLEFTPALRNLDAPGFAREILAGAVQARLVVLGYNNRFGRGGEGDVELLRRLGPELGFEARSVAEVRIGDQPVSSTSIRAAVLRGDLDRASLMLGRPFSVLGRVVEGDGVGRRHGVPTANLDLRHEVRPPRGVYGGEALVGPRRFPALINIGIRPTMDPGGAASPAAAPDDWPRRDREERIEAHLLGFEGDLYGQELELFFLVRLRDERLFDGPAALKAQIDRDREAFLAWRERGVPPR
jgi:riboflavin kinase/FMN adenylyltransferase